MANSHDKLIEAFNSIQDKNALAWSVIDTKSELAVTLAIAVTANRKVNKRIAFVEHKRIDLCFVNEDNSLSLYQAKAAYFSDYQPNRIANINDHYLGRCIDKDFEKIEIFAKANKNVRDYACLFYIYEMSKPHKHSKYGKHANAPLEIILKTIQSQVIKGKINSHQIIDCGIADECEIKIHLFIFDPLNI